MNNRKEFMKALAASMHWDEKTDDEVKEILSKRWTQLGFPFDERALDAAIKFLREELL